VIGSGGENIRRLRSEVHIAFLLCLSGLKEKLDVIGYSC